MGGSVRSAADPWVGRIREGVSARQEAILLNNEFTRINDRISKELKLGAESKYWGRIYSTTGDMTGTESMMAGIATDLGIDPIALVERTVKFFDGLLDIGKIRVDSTRILRRSISIQVYRLADGAGPGSFMQGYSHVDDCSAMSLLQVYDWLSRVSDHPTWVVLDPDSFDAWFQTYTVPGSLSIPDDEVRLYQAMGEELPYLWPSAKFVEWAVGRWGRT